MERRLSHPHSGAHGAILGRTTEPASIALPALLFGLAHFNGSFIQPAIVMMLGVLAGSNGCLIAVVALAA